MCAAGSHLDDVVSAEHTASVSPITMFSDGALHLKAPSSESVGPWPRHDDSEG